MFMVFVIELDVIICCVEDGNDPMINLLTATVQPGVDRIRRRAAESILLR
jgi:hypothetical protein